MKNKLIGKKFYLRVPAYGHGKRAMMYITSVFEDRNWVHVAPVFCPSNPSGFDIEMALLEPVERKRRFFGLLKPITWWKEECNIFEDIAVSATCKTRLMNELLVDIDTRIRPNERKDKIINEFIYVIHCIQTGLTFAKKDDSPVDCTLMRQTSVTVVQALQERLTVKQ